SKVSGGATDVTSTVPSSDASMATTVPTRAPSSDAPNSAAAGVAATTASSFPTPAKVGSATPATGISAAPILTVSTTSVAPGAVIPMIITTTTTTSGATSPSLVSTSSPQSDTVSTSVSTVSGTTTTTTTTTTEAVPVALDQAAGLLKPSHDAGVRVEDLDPASLSLEELTEGAKPPRAAATDDTGSSQLLVDLGPGEASIQGQRGRRSQKSATGVVPRSRRLEKAGISQHLPQVQFSQFTSHLFLSPTLQLSRSMLTLLRTCVSKCSTSPLDMSPSAALTFDVSKIGQGDALQRERDAWHSYFLPSVYSGPGNTYRAVVQQSKGLNMAVDIKIRGQSLQWYGEYASLWQKQRYVDVVLLNEGWDAGAAPWVFPDLGLGDAASSPRRILASIPTANDAPPVTRMLSADTEMTSGDSTAQDRLAPKVRGQSIGTGGEAAETVTKVGKFKGEPAASVGEHGAPAVSPDSSVAASEAAGSTSPPASPVIPAAEEAAVLQDHTTFTSTLQPSTVAAQEVSTATTSRTATSASTLATASTTTTAAPLGVHSSDREKAVSYLSGESAAAQEMDTEKPKSAAEKVSQSVQSVLSAVVNAAVGSNDHKSEATSTQGRGSGTTSLLSAFPFLGLWVSPSGDSADVLRPAPDQSARVKLALGSGRYRSDTRFPGRQRLRLDREFVGTLLAAKQGLWRAKFLAIDGVGDFYDGHADCGGFFAIEDNDRNVQLDGSGTKNAVADPIRSGARGRSSAFRVGAQQLRRQRSGRLQGHPETASNSRRERTVEAANGVGTTEGGPDSSSSWFSWLFGSNRRSSWWGANEVVDERSQTTNKKSLRNPRLHAAQAYAAWLGPDSLLLSPESGRHYAYQSSTLSAGTTRDLNVLLAVAETLVKEPARKASSSKNSDADEHNKDASKEKGGSTWEPTQGGPNFVASAIASDFVLSRGADANPREIRRRALESASTTTSDLRLEGAANKNNVTTASMWLSKSASIDRHLALSESTAQRVEAQEGEHLRAVSTGTVHRGTAKIAGPAAISFESGSYCSPFFVEFFHSVSCGGSVGSSADFTLYLRAKEQAFWAWGQNLNIRSGEEAEEENAEEANTEFEEGQQTPEVLHSSSSAYGQQRSSKTHDLEPAVDHGANFVGPATVGKGSPSDTGQTLRRILASTVGETSSSGRRQVPNVIPDQSDDGVAVPTHGESDAHLSPADIVTSLEGTTTQSVTKNKLSNAERAELRQELVTFRDYRLWRKLARGPLFPLNAISRAFSLLTAFDELASPSRATRRSSGDAVPDEDGGVTSNFKVTEIPFESRPRATSTSAFSTFETAQLRDFILQLRYFVFQGAGLQQMMSSSVEDAFSHVAGAISTGRILARESWQQDLLVPHIEQALNYTRAVEDLFLDAHWIENRDPRWSVYGTAAFQVLRCPCHTGLLNWRNPLNRTETTLGVPNPLTLHVYKLFFVTDNAALNRTETTSRLVTSFLLSWCSQQWIMLLVVKQRFFALCKTDSIELRSDAWASLHEYPRFIR
ncbi:unnamed protein product, partial [Amoebophrya sp. A25]